jgi:hypothetical protein
VLHDRGHGGLRDRTSFQQKLDWVDRLVRDEVLRPFQQQVKAQELWAVHLGPELVGPPPHRREEARAALPHRLELDVAELRP